MKSVDLPRVPGTCQRCKTEVADRGELVLAILTVDGRSKDYGNVCSPCFKQLKELRDSGNPE